MKKDTKTLLKVVSVTAAVSFVVERILERIYPKVEKKFVKIDDIESCLREATVAEMQNELMKRQTEGSELKKKG